MNTLQEQLAKMKPHTTPGKFFDLWYKPNAEARVWRKAHLTMGNHQSLQTIGERLQAQERWFAIHILPQGENPNE